MSLVEQVTDPVRDDRYLSGSSGWRASDDSGEDVRLHHALAVELRCCGRAEHKLCSHVARTNASSSEHGFETIVETTGSQTS